MFRNYLKTAWRNILSHRFVSLTNLFGITVGLTCCLTIMCYVLGELSYDRFANADNIYRVTRSFYTDQGTETLHLASVAPPVGPLLQNDFPDIREVTRFEPFGNIVVKYGEKTFMESNCGWADANFFDFFTVPVIRGNPNTVLSEPNSAVLTETEAQKYFGSADPIGKIVLLQGKYPFKVTGIFQDFPPNTHLHPDLLLSFSTLNNPDIYGLKRLQADWGNNSFYTYLMFPPNYPVNKIVKQFPAFLDKHLHYPGQAPGEGSSKETSLFLQKLTDIHLYSHLDSEIEENGNIKTVYVFSAIALFILLIACINYMNLATARAMLRAREIGVRKAIGAGRRTLVFQFLGESVLVTLGTLLLALAFTALLLPYMGRLAGRDLSMGALMHWDILVVVILLPLIVGLASGIYPAVFMSSFKPVSVLKGSSGKSSGKASFRKVLVVLQFAISIILILATTVVFKQLKYVQDASLGFDKDHIITMGYNSSLDNAFDTFRETLLQNPAIKSIGLSSRIPSGRLLDENGMRVLGDDSARGDHVSLKVVGVDQGFIPTYGIRMTVGRNFDSRSYPTDSTGYVLNETAVRMIGWKDPANALGKGLSYGGVDGKIIGVMHDFHFESLHQKIIPLLLKLGSVNNGLFGNISIKLKAGMIPSGIAQVKHAWETFVPDAPFSYSFLDDRFQNLYKPEQRQETIFTIFSVIAIFIACLGLFGLSAFTISQRAKEISIRKVLGASLRSLIGLLSRDFLLLVGLAAVVALPVGWILMHRWLENFAYHIRISWWVLAFAGIVAALVALVTIGLQALKAARANPVRALRSE